MRRTQQIERTRRALLQAAAVEFAAHGYTATTVHRVSDRIGMTEGAVTFHYPTKGQLARVVGEAWTEMWIAEVARSTERGLDLRELESFMVRTTEQAQRDPLWRATIRLAREREHIPGDVPRPSDAWLTLIRAALHASKETGVLRPNLDVEGASWQLTAHVIGMHSLMVDAPGKQSAPERVQQLLDAHRSMLAAT
ncbi:TetR family transcriptional regulator [Pseudoclavibacter helvolus]|uniref:TetR family transcriptional regulator n=1 Tax=Pseudoclavibacter helvolus TaxID=255205 RepID=UPI003734F8EE